MNNHYSHIITGDVNNAKKGGFVNSYPKVQSMENQEESIFKNLEKKYKLVLINSLRKCQIARKTM